MIFKYLFAPRDTEKFPPCGMFSTSHLISLLIFTVLIAIGIYFSLKVKKEKFNLIIKIFAVVFTLLEIIKIVYNFSYGYTWVDAWVPLAYCSLFIYSLIFAGFFKGKLKDLGLSFLSCGVFAGAFFMIFPTTSLMLHPIYHFLSLHSLIFHSSMLYIGVMVIIKEMVKPSNKSFLSYFCFLLAFSVIAIIINGFKDSNLMFYSAPYNMPIKLVVSIYEFSNVLYSAFIFFAYLSLYVLFIILYKLINLLKIKGRRHEL